MIVGLFEFEPLRFSINGDNGFKWRFGSCQMVEGLNHVRCCEAWQDIGQVLESEQSSLFGSLL